MEEYIAKLREKPLHIKRTILVVATTAITGLIFSVWLSSRTGNFAPVEESNNTAAPTSILLNNLSDLGKTMKSGFTEIRNQMGL